MASSSSSSALQRGIVKSVQSGDSIIVRGQPKGGPPPEKQINLAYLIAPKISRKLPDGTYTEDEPYAWEAREFLRKRLVGKEVAFRVEYKLPFGKGERECATVLNSLEPGTGSENISELLVSEGLVEVVKRAQNKDNPEVIRLTELEEAAKAAGKGKWAAAAGTSPAPIKRTLLQPDLDNGQALVGKTYDGIVEHVRDGATLRVGLFTSCSAAEAATADQGAIDFQVVTLQLSGVRCPLSSEPFGEEARFFTETRLLQRDVRVRLEQFNTNGLNPSYTGTVTFLERDIAEYLLREGYAKVVDWTLALTAEPKKLRALEREAKEKRLRLWREYKGDTSGRSTAIAVPKGTASKFDAKVLEITNADSLVVQNLETKEVKKIFLSSVRPPRLPQQHNPETGEPLPNQSAAASGRQFRPLYDIPYMFEARECLRKKLIGKPVKVSIDYIQPKTDSFPEKICCTVLAADGSNVAEQLIIKGLVTVVRYRADDDQRAADYDAYLAAEMKAQKMGKGVWNTSTSGKSAEAGLVRVADLSTDLTKSRSFAPFLTKAGQRKEAVVEYVFPSSTKLKLWIPKENCLINLILGGVNTPKPNDPTAAEAVAWAKLKVYQREVFVEIETQDKAGNYIGALYYDKTHNLAVELVRAGLLAVREYNTKAEFNAAQADAQAAKKGIWKDWQPEDPAGGDAYNGADLEDGTEEGGAEGGATAAAAASGTTAAAAATGPASGTPDDLAQRKKVVITHVSTAFTTFHAQAVDDGPKIEELQRRLREEAKNNPPLPGSYRPKRGDLAMARFSEDGQWYRVRVDKTVNAAESQVLYIDYGNREVLKNGEIAALPMGAAFSSAPPGAKEYAFAFVYPDTDPDTVEEVRAEFLAETGDKVLLLKTEYRAPESSLEAATLLVDEGATKKDVVLGLVADGWLFVDTKARRGGRLWKKFNEYKEAQEAAKKNGLNLWQYGDVTPDDAKEFGYPTLH